MLFDGYSIKRHNFSVDKNSKHNIFISTIIKCRTCSRQVNDHQLKLEVIHKSTVVGFTLCYHDF